MNQWRHLANLQANYVSNQAACNAQTNEKKVNKGRKHHMRGKREMEESKKRGVPMPTEDGMRAK